MKPARIAVICVAAVAAIGLAFVVRAMGSSNNQPAATAVAAPVETRPMAKVLVAASDLQPGQRLTEGDLDWKDWAVEEVNPAFITDGSVPIPANPTAAGDKPATPDGTVASVTRVANEIATSGGKADYIGSVVREPILAGEPIVTRKIVRAGDSGYLAAYLEPGMRAMAIKVSVESAAGGFILPGDRVDLVVTRETPATAEGGSTRRVSGTVLQNIKVLAIDQSTRAGDDEQAVVGATATLEIRPQDAEVLALAKDTGEISLSLRSYADAAGPSGSTGRRSQPQSTAVRVFRGGAPEVVTVQ